MKQDAGIPNDSDETGNGSWSVVTRHYRTNEKRYELLRNKHIHNGKVLGEVIMISGDKESLQWIAVNHNNDLEKTCQSRAAMSKSNRGNQIRTFRLRRLPLVATQL